VRSDPSAKGKCLCPTSDTDCRPQLHPLLLHRLSRLRLLGLQWDRDPIAVSVRLHHNVGMSGIVEVERGGMIFRAAYTTEGKVVTVTYGSIVKKLTMRRDTDEPSSVARQLLIKIIAEIHN
jgi:hypothetical protein